MAKQSEKVVLFLGAGNYHRCRFAEILFNHVAGKFGLSWTASSRGLALERGASHVGPMAASAITCLAKMGVRPTEAFARFPQAAERAELDDANFVVALKQAEHLPLLEERFPTCVERIEFWDVDDDAAAPGLIEREVMDLISRLISGRNRGASIVHAAELLEPKTPINKAAERNREVVRVGRETKGRRGKGVTTISDVPLDDAGLQQLASTLKHRCGTGGAVKDRRIEIQGDQRERIASVLEGLGYRVKRVGG